MTENQSDDSQTEGLEQEGAEKLAASPELEEALREAAEAVEAREAASYAVGEQDEKEPEAEQAELDSLREELERSQERLLRLQADFDNSRKRALKERQEAYRFGHQNLVKDLLGTVDNLDRAIEHARNNEDGDFESMLQGVELVQRELLGVLEAHGVNRVDPQGEPFDPTVHEAMAQEQDGSVPANTVVIVLQKGYQLHERLLRPARVVVSKPPEESGERAAEAESRDGDADE